MSTMYIACNNTMPRGYFLGDVLTLIKVAWMFVENEPHDHVILSLHDREPLNFLWDKFVADNLVTVIRDRWEQANQEAQHAALDERLTGRRVKGIAFDTYKELYPRLEGGARQAILCGRENGISRKNIFCYYYFGQQAWRENPRGDETFGPELIDVPAMPRRTGRSVLVAPHEKCHGNGVFTHAFWEQVILALVRAEIEVTVNDDRGFMQNAEGPLLKRSYSPFRELVGQVAGQRLVIAGNNGIGWLAGATGTPLLALERNAVFPEYSFARCGLRSLAAVIDQPDAPRVVQWVIDYLGGPS